MSSAQVELPLRDEGLRDESLFQALGTLKKFFFYKPVFPKLINNSKGSAPHCQLCQGSANGKRVKTGSQAFPTAGALREREKPPGEAAALRLGCGAPRRRRGSRVARRDAAAGRERARAVPVAGSCTSSLWPPSAGCTRAPAR